MAEARMVNLPDRPGANPRPDPRSDASTELARLRSELQHERAASAARLHALAGICHDLRQPLQAISLFADQLERLNRDATLQPVVCRLQAGVAALDGSFTELLDLASLAAGGRPVHMQPVALASVYDALQRQFGPLATDQGLALRLRDAHRVVWADPLMLQRVLANLLANALRHTRDGGVLLACRQRGPGHLLQVWDSGCGMPAEVLGRIFDAFYQVPRRSASASEPLDGPLGHNLGLGLNIAQGLARAMGSTLTVCSRPAQGSLFSLWLAAPPPPAGHAHS
jgi:signal transduction histidine kinase